MDGQVGTVGTIGFEGGDEAAVAVVVALHEMKIATWVTPDQVVDPTDGMPDCFVGTGQRRPAEIKNITAKDESFRLTGSRVNCGLVSRRLGAARAEVKVGKEVCLHAGFSSEQAGGEPAL